jgi:hypothetical protein
MTELRDDFLHAISRLLLPNAKPSALEDLTNRLVQNQPADVVSYIATLRSQLPHAFEAAPPEPAAPTPDQPGWNAYALANLETLAGTAPPAGAGGSPPPKPPVSVARDDPAAFLRHLEAIANGTVKMDN